MPSSVKTSPKSSFAKNRFAKNSDDPLSGIAPKKTRDESFAASRRIKKPFEFKELQELGKRRYSNHLIVYLLKTKNSQRLGITVSKKVHKRAVKRNRIKRYIREAFRKQRPTFTGTFDILVIARKNAFQLSCSEIEQELLNILKFWKAV